MLPLRTIAGLYEHRHELHAFCPRCERCSALNLERTIEAEGDRRLPITVRCQDCGQVGTLQVRPPMPTWANSSGWMQTS